VLYFGTKGAVRLARTIFEHAEDLLNRGFGHEEIADGFERAANWFVNHIESHLSPEFIMMVTQTVKLALTQSEKEEEEADQVGVALEAQENPVEELGQAEGGAGGEENDDGQAEAGTNPILDDDVSKKDLEQYLILTLLSDVECSFPLTFLTF